MKQDNAEIIVKMLNNKKIFKSMKKLQDLSKKYKMTFSFGEKNVVLDNRLKKDNI